MIFMSNFVLPYEMIMLLVYIIYGLEFLSSFLLAVARPIVGSTSIALLIYTEFNSPIID